MTFFANLPHNVLTVAIFFLMLLVLVGAHEMGHYLFARLFGMATEEFAIGMFGKPLVVLGKRRYTIPLQPGDDPENRGETNPLEGGASKEPTEIVETPNGWLLRETTVFTIRPWPIGGFVRIKGMIPQEDGGETRVPGGFFSKAPWKRWIVLAAGPAFSIVAGILLLVPTLVFQGEPKETTKPYISRLVEGSAADKAGLKAGDLVLSIDGNPVAKWYDMVVQVRDRKSPYVVVADRGGRRIETTVQAVSGEKPTPVLGPDGKPTKEMRIQTLLGAGGGYTLEKLPLGRAVVRATELPAEATVDLLKRVAHPSELAASVGGPGTMVKQTSMSIDEGFWPMIGFAGGISISLGIFNLLPFPPLDGGQMWIAFAEMLRGGRRLSMRTQVRVINVGFAFVLMLICTVLVIDVRRWVFPEDAATVKGK